MLLLLDINRNIDKIGRINMIRVPQFLNRLLIQTFGQFKSQSVQMSS